MVNHSFTVPCLLDSLLLNRDVRPGARLQDVLSASARLLLGDAGGPLATSIAEGKYALPSVSLLRSSRVRLDLMFVLFQQRLFSRGQYRHYQVLDSSPQLGYNILAVLEDTFLIPERHTLDLHVYLAANAADHYFSWICPLSSLGLGKAGRVEKSTNSCNITLMHSGTDANFETKRHNYRGVTSDQGTEKSHGDTFVGILPGYQDRFAPSSSHSFIYPNALNMPGFLHLLYNALEESVKHDAEYQHVIDILRITANFSNKKECRTKFIHDCFEPGDPDAKLFMTGAAVHIDWKWEFLSVSLEQLLPKFRVIHRKFDLAKMLKSDAGVLINQSITNMNDVKDDDIFEGAWAFLSDVWKGYREARPHYGDLSLSC